MIVVIALPFTILIAGIVFSFLDWLRHLLSRRLSWKADHMHGGFIYRTLADFLQGEIMLLFNISLTVSFWFIIIIALLVVTGVYNG